MLVGESEDEVERLVEERTARGTSDGLTWAGPADRFAEHLLELAEAGATWAIMVLAGPAGRRELLAERVLPAVSAWRS